MNPESASCTSNPRLLGIIEILPRPGPGTEPGLHLDGDPDVTDASDQVYLVTPDSDIAIEDGRVAAFEESSSYGLTRCSDGQTMC